MKLAFVSIPFFEKAQKKRVCKKGGQQPEFWFCSLSSTHIAPVELCYIKSAV